MMVHTKINFTLFAGVFLLLMVACTAPSAYVPNPDKDVDRIENAHHKQAFLSKEAIQFDIHLRFRGNDRMKGKMTLSTDSRFARIDLASGDAIYVQDDKVHYSPNYPKAEKVRFDAYTWSYFFLIPYKLSDPGTIWGETRESALNDSVFIEKKLSFEAGTGDAPDDWYIFYVNPQTHLIRASAYIVTANKTVAEAEEDPHAIEYTKYQDVDGIPIAHEWNFWNWSKEKGLFDQIGQANLNNFKFITPEKGFFDPPQDFLESK